MKVLLTLLFSLPIFLMAQAPSAADSVAIDTTIYQIVDEKPRFPTPCERYDTTALAKEGCSEIALLNYINKRAMYPTEAREQNISGMVVIGFIVEANGRISEARILRDPGGQLGMSALRTVIGMANEVPFRPAFKEGKPVRYRYTLPIRFRLEEQKPYVMSGADTIYVQLTKALEFTGMNGDLAGYFNEALTYPASGEDSCRTGQLDLQLIVHPDGRVDVQDVIDYNDLGTDFTFEAMNIATSSFNKWSPGEYNGRPVSSAYDVSFTFAPESDACETVIDDYNVAVALINEGNALSKDSISLDQGLIKMDRAVEMFPRDGRFRIVRGQARMDNNLLSGACEDLQLAKEIALIDWYDTVLPLLCREGN
ncbi:MAG: energy transducer TonB [Lewinella sp.]|nr:energy transducer TonB [Lewinella sp.]